jgi:hypothetical protein
MTESLWIKGKKYLALPAVRRFWTVISLAQSLRCQPTSGFVLSLWNPPISTPVKINMVVELSSRGRGRTFMRALRLDLL